MGGREGGKDGGMEGGMEGEVNEGRIDGGRGKERKDGERRTSAIFICFSE